tara:strand:+ start:273 stop:569 length:297 start_codon:yes stop_codon:yes gene_type:complete
MADYNKDMQDREREKQERIKEVEARKKRTMNYNNSVKIGESTKHSYNVVIDDEQFLQIAKKAARHDVTFNQMVNLTLLKNLKDDNSQSENSPQLLNEG